jgi:hypothetical protein
VTKRALHEIDLSTNTVRVIPLRGLADHEEVFGVASGDGGKILFISVKNLWAFDQRTSRVTKLCSAPPSGKPFNEIAHDPKSHAAYIRTDNPPDFFMVKNGRELVSVELGPHAQVNCPVFSSEGELFYADQGCGDLWSGKIESDAHELWVTAERYAPLAYLETSNQRPSPLEVSNVAIAREAIYVQLFWVIKGQGFGVFLKLPRTPSNAEGESSLPKLAIRQLDHCKEIFQGLEKLGETEDCNELGASPDGSRVYYKKHDGEYLVTNGRTQKLQLREVDQNADTHMSTSVAANSVEAKTEPPSPATIPSDVVAAVAEREIDAISTQKIDTLVYFYADKVDLLDKGMVSKETVRNNLQQYFDRWPVTKWTLAGKVDVKPLSASRYQLAYPVTFEVSNPASNRRIVGTANETRIVAIDSAGAAKIVSQREKIIRSRTVGR